MSRKQIFLLLLLLLSSYSTAKVYYVKPTEKATCPVSYTCHTLYEYVRNASQYFNNVQNVTFLLLQGVHTVNLTLNVTGSTNLSIKAATPDSNVSILFSDTVVFADTRILSFEHLTLEFYVINFVAVTNLEMLSVTLHQGFIYAYNIYGNSSLTKLKFLFGSTLQFVLNCTNHFSPLGNASSQLVIRDTLFDSQGGNSLLTALTVVSRGVCPLNVSVVHSNFTNILFECAYRDYVALHCASAVEVDITDNDSVTFVDTLFWNNTAISPIGLVATVHLTGARTLKFVDCSFQRNKGTPIIAVNSTFHISGNYIDFVDNSALRGGALAFYSGSLVVIEENTRVLFENNVADLVGGAIYVEQGPSFQFFEMDCFFLIVGDGALSHQKSLVFKNNTARYGGDDLYGGNLDSCSLRQDNSWCSQQYPVQCFEKLSHFEPEKVSHISSNPSRVCLCEGKGKPNCIGNTTSSIFLPVKHYYPGQKFNIEVALVGDTLGTVGGGSVYAHLLPNTAHLDHLQATQLVKSKENCTKLEYTIINSIVNTTSVVLVLTATEIADTSIVSRDVVKRMIEDFHRTDNCFTKASLPLQYIPMYQNITLKSCPVGLVASSNSCECNEEVMNKGISCNVGNYKFTRSGTSWIQISEDHIEVSDSCPYSYCLHDNVTVEKGHERQQCNKQHNREGRLCGRCMKNYSLALSTAKCLPNCPSQYWLLLLFFAFAGIALPFFIKLLNLTVSKGAINGLLFYMNVVGIESSPFFSEDKINFFRVFISWMNLDFGLETCFFDGFDFYIKTWFQMLFPFYIFCIVGSIILLSRYSTRVAGLFGTNCTDVLATLVLLSYTKLFATAMRALWYATIVTIPESGETSTDIVWMLDGSIKYLHGKHIPLFVVAILVLVLLWFPFTMILLFWQLLQKLSHYRIVHWIVVKKMPFFENYFCPLKGEHRYWIGVLLLCRSIIVIFSIVNGIKVYLLVITTVVLLLLAYTANLPLSLGTRNVDSKQKASKFLSGCYRNWYLSVLESSFFLNLGLLSLSSIFLQPVDDTNNSAVKLQKVFTYLSVSIVFVQFVGIVAYQLVLSLRKWWQKRCRISDLGPVNPLADPNADNNVEEEGSPPNTFYGSCSQYRDPVLSHFD